jgi:sulfur carrier protein ThiS
LKVEVHLHTTLRRQTPEGLLDKLNVSLPAGSTISELLEALNISIAPDSLLFVLNGRTAEIDQVLTDGDIVNLMTAMSGG